MLPCPNCCATSDTATPLPTAVALTPSCVAANRSANSAREPLKPTVATLARLFSVTDRSWLAALRPARAILNDMGDGSLENEVAAGCLLHAHDRSQGDNAVAGVQVQRLGTRIDGDAGDFAGDQGTDALTRAAHGGIDGDAVLAGGCGRAGGGGAVPAESGEAGGLRRNHEGLNGVAAGVADRDREAGGTAGGERCAAAGAEHGAPEERGAARHLRRLNVGRQLGLQSLQARDLAQAFQLRQELGRIGWLQGILILQLRGN